ncbi:MAG: LysE family transporter [Chthoniobacterales bacterium]
MFTSTVVKGFILGWSVAWPPGPVNAEMMRRCVLPHRQGGGFWPAYLLGLGACTGDFMWALGVATGAGALMNTPRVRTLLGIVSLLLLFFLAFVFARNAWRTARAYRRPEDSPSQSEAAAEIRPHRAFRGYLLGFTLAVTSPWNLGFWLAVIGSQQADAGQRTFAGCVALAAFVVLGAATWGLVLCVVARQGGRVFARPVWQITTQALTAAVMICFAAKLATQLW